MKYIETFREGEKISDIYLCKHKTSAVTKNGKPYDSVILQDKTGQIDAKIWDPNSMGIDDFDSLDYVEVVDALTMQAVDTLEGTVLTAVAVYIGKTRLIDNFMITI